MGFWSIVVKSAREHWMPVSLAALSIALGVALLTAVTSLREQTHRSFMEEGLGVDAVLGPKGSPLQIALNALYHLEEMPGKIKWSYYKAVLGSEVVESGIPFITGHSYAGFRVNAIDASFLESFEYLPGHRFSCSQGRVFQARDEAVAGSEAAKALKLHVGMVFNPVCGVNPGGIVHKDQIKFVGVLAPTGTPHDRAIYIPLTTFYTLSGHSKDVQEMAVNEETREISGAFLKIKRIRGGVLHPGIQDLKYEVNNSERAQLIVPNEVIPKLFGIIGWVDDVLKGVSLLVSALALLFLFVSLLTAMRERRRDLALLRCLGATRRTVFGLILAEAALISLAGAFLGLAAGHGIVAIGARLIKVETGLRLSAWQLSSADIWTLPAILLLGLLAGLVPAIQAYRNGALEGLHINQ